MPSVPVIDTHVHFWDPAVLRIPWIDEIELLNRRYDLHEYTTHASGLEIEALVYVQVDAAPAYGLVEAAWVAAQAQHDPRLRGIVAYAPLEEGLRVCSYLDMLVQVPLVKGVRRITQNEADPAFCLRPGFVEGVQQLASYGLSCDLCIYHHQLAATIELVRRCPEVSFMLDHCAKPGIKDGLHEPWRTQLAELATLPNVYCKISGLVNEAKLIEWTIDDLAPYVAHALAVFGEDRVVFSSDWPVMLLGSPYRRWVDTIDTLTADRSPEAQRKLWAENARRFYRLEHSS